MIKVMQCFGVCFKYRIVCYTLWVLVMKCCVQPDFLQVSTVHPQLPVAFYRKCLLQNIHLAACDENIPDKCSFLSVCLHGLSAYVQ